MMNHLYGFFQTVHDKAVRVESFFSKAIEHSRPLIKGPVSSLEDAAGASGHIALFNDSHFASSF